MLHGRGELRIRRFDAMGTLEVDRKESGPLQTLRETVDGHWQTLGPGDTLHVQLVREGGPDGS